MQPEGVGNLIELDYFIECETCDLQACSTVLQEVYKTDSIAMLLACLICRFSLGSEDN
jgi:hypothetical protein